MIALLQGRLYQKHYTWCLEEFKAFLFILLFKSIESQRNQGSNDRQEESLTWVTWFGVSFFSRCYTSTLFGIIKIASFIRFSFLYLRRIKVQIIKILLRNDKEALFCFSRRVPWCTTLWWTIKGKKFNFCGSWHWFKQVASATINWHPSETERCSSWSNNRQLITLFAID